MASQPDRRSGCLTAALVAAIAAALGSSPAPARAQDEARLVARMMVTSRVHGHFADPVCGGGRTLVPSRFARYAEWMRREGASPGAGPAGGVLLFDTGGLLAAHGVARFAAEHTPAALADLVQQLGYRALGIGEADLAAPREPLVQALAVLRERRIPAIATNLYCDAEARELCDVTVDAADGVSIQPVGQERVALVGLVSPRTLERVAPERARGLRLAPPAPVLAEAVRDARAAGATMVVASYDDGTGAQAVARVLDLVRELPPDGKPDVLLSSGAGDQLLFARPSGFRPAVAAAPPGTPARLRIRRNLLADTFDVLVRPVPPASVEHRAVERFVGRIGERYCERWGVRLVGGALDRPMTGPALLDLTAGAMRTAARAEVAMLDRRLLDPSWSPAEPGALTASDVFVALRYDEPLVEADASGAWIKKAVEQDPSWLLALGASLDEGELRINGRPVEPQARYDVVTMRLLTSGQQGLPEGPEWEPLGEATLRSVVLDHLSRRRDADPRDALYEPSEHPEWTFRAEIDGSFASSSVNNPQDAGTMERVYDDAQLQRDDTTTVGLQSRLRADALAPDWGWDNVAEARYRRTRVPPADAEEGDDILSLRSTLRWRELRERSPHFYVPEPFVEGYLESEMTVPEERSFRHMLVRPQAGLQFTLTDHLSLKLSGGFEVEALSPEKDVLPGVGGQLVLKPWTLMEAGDRRIELQGDADYFVSDVAATSTQTLRGRFKATVGLFGPLALGWSIDLFVAKRQGEDVGVNSTAEVFLRVAWVGRTVGP